MRGRHAWVVMRYIAGPRYYDLLVFPIYNTNLCLCMFFYKTTSFDTFAWRDGGFICHTLYVSNFIHKLLIYLNTNNITSIQQFVTDI